MLAELSRGMRSLLFPSPCAGCGGETPAEPEEMPLCPLCWAGLPWMRNVCPPESPALDGAVALWAYEGAARELVQGLKYRGLLRLAPFLGRELARAVRPALEGKPAPTVAAVPLHPTRLRERTFNQADVLARRLAEELGLPYHPDLLRRPAPTHAQPGLSREERAVNVRGVFEADPSSLLPGAHVLLVDDVLTTGATAGACALALKAAGAGRVTAATLARG
ncbi:MAG: ComF family protein [Candidatus Omnitrophica bacterium]|nr:ComF family protein [Candidatus Omnitrophota bacterium]